MPCPSATGARYDAELTHACARRPVSSRLSGRRSARATGSPSAHGARRPPSCRRRRCSAASPPWPASTSTSPRARSCSCRGPNGAGKTTLLRACAGLVPVGRRRGGRARPRPAPTTASAAVRRRVGLLGHATAPLRRPDRGRQRALLGPGRRRRPTADADAAMDRLGLDGRLRDVPVARLSAGQRRRTSLGRASWPAGPSCGCSTSPTPGSTRPAATCVDGLVATPPRPAPPWSSPSHELDRADRGRRPRRHAGRRHRRRSPPAAPDPAPAATAPGPCRRPGGRRCCVTPRLVAGKDLRVEAAQPGDHSTRSLPFAFLVLRAVRLRPRPRPRRPGPGRRPACSGWRCCSPRCSPSSGPSPSRRPTATATPCASPASTPAGDLPRQGRRRRRRSSWPSRSCSLSGVVVLYGADIDGAAPACLLVVTCAGRDRRAGRRRYPLRRPGRRAAGRGRRCCRCSSCRCWRRC